MHWTLCLDRDGGVKACWWLSWDCCGIKMNEYWTQLQRLPHQACQIGQFMYPVANPIHIAKATSTTMAALMRSQVPER
jgi:hypothetical protein